jgi:hypothetical protein
MLTHIQKPAVMLTFNYNYSSLTDGFYICNSRQCIYERAVHRGRQCMVH